MAGADRQPLQIGDHTVGAGERLSLNLPVARLPTGDWLSLPVVALNGSRPGPGLWLDAAIHGDEINGMEIIHRVLDRLDAKELSGHILAVPIVNVFGFVQQSRYLPDRRDLNRFFPGSRRGSLASRLANLFMREIVARCEFGMDLHTGSLHRTNLPQIRADLSDPESRELAAVFAAPMMYSAKEIKGSLRAAARRRGARILVYEAGEPLRFNQDAIDIGVRGVLRVLDHLGMRRLAKGERRKPAGSFVADKTHWLRAGRSGILHLETRLGQRVRDGQKLGSVSDPAEHGGDAVFADRDGMVIGFTNNPLVHQGDALIHLASASSA